MKAHRIILALATFAVASCNASDNTESKTEPKTDSPEGVVLKLHHADEPTDAFPETIAPDKCHRVLVRRWSTNPAKTSHLGFGSPFKATLSLDNLDAGAFYADENCETKVDSVEISQQEVDEGGRVNSAIFYFKSSPLSAQVTIAVDATALGYAAATATTKIKGGAEGSVLKLHHSSDPTGAFPATIAVGTCHGLLLRRWSTDPAEPSQLNFEAPFKAALTIDGGNADADVLYSDEDCQTKTDSLTITQGEIDDGVVNSAVFYLKAATVGASLTINVEATALGFAAVNVTAEVVP